MVKEGELTLQKDTKKGSTSNRCKTKYVNKNQEILNDVVVDNVTPKPTKASFNLTDGLNAAKNVEKPPPDNKTSRSKQDNDKPKTPFLLRGPTSNTMDNTPSQNCANAITHSHAELVLKGRVPSTPDFEQHKDKTLASPSSKGEKLTMNSMETSYSVLSQLK